MAAYAGVDTFESYSVGGLNGGNGGSGWSGAWSGDTSFTVQSTVTRSAGSTRAVKLPSGSTADILQTRILSAAADSGDIYFSMRKGGGVTGLVQDTFFYSGGTLAFYVRADQGGAASINLVGTTTETIVATPAGDTWYDFHINFVSSTSVKARYRTPGGAWGAFTNAVTLAGSASSVDRVKIHWDSFGTPRDLYWDDIQNTDPDAVAGALPRPVFARQAVNRASTY